MTDVTEGHTVRKYDRELGTARKLVLKMGAQVLEQVRKAVSALDKGDVDLAREVVDNERKIDSFELEIDEAIFDLIAKRQPAAIDLRFILALSKVAGDLERAGDKAAQIAWCVIRLMGRTSRRPTSKILHHIKNRIQDFAKIGRSLASSGIGFELIKNRLENFPLFINEVARVPDRKLSLFRSYIGIRNRSAHSYYSTRKSGFFIIKNQ